MRKLSLPFISLFLITFVVQAQNSSPYWSLAGNSNASTSSKLGTTNSIPLRLLTNNIERMRIAPSGKVGIGTTTPLTLFQVKGSGSFGSKVTSLNATRALNIADDNAVMRILRVHSTYAPAVELISRTSADGPNVAYWDMYAEPKDASFRIRDRQGGGSGLDRITIAHTTGYIGIGTTAPSQKLEVVGNVSVSGDVYIAGNRFISSNSATNTAVGTNALNSNTTGDYNTANGYYALLNNTTGYNNTTNGSYSLGNNTTGYFNTANGVGALGSNTTGNYNTANGAGAGVALDNLTNATAIGYSAIATASNQIMLGNTSVTSVVAAGNFVIYSDGRFKKDIKEEVPGLEFINKLRPVTYHYNIHDLNTHTRSGNTAAGQRVGNQPTIEVEAKVKAQEEAAIKAKEQKLYTGFVAQEVEKAANEINYDFSGVYKPANDKDVYGLSYSDFVVPLVKAVQELSKKTEEIEELKKEVAELKALITGKAANNRAALSSINLEQNTPNPFTRTTTIHYSIPVGVQKSDLLITDYSGKAIKTIPISSGSSSISVDASLLSSGAYNYSIIVDGRTIATKKMIVSK